MSDELNMEEIDFGAGILDEAGVNAQDIPDDPFGFGNQHWPVVVLEVGPAKLTKNKDKIGAMVKFGIDHPQYAGHYLSQGLGNGDWYRLPVPLKIRAQVPWDPNGEGEQKAIFRLGQLYKALGFPKDQWGKIQLPMLVGKRMMAKIRPVQDELGFWKFNLNNLKTVGEGADSGWSGNSSSAPASSGKTAEELAKEELARSLAE